MFTAFTAPFNASGNPAMSVPLHWATRVCRSACSSLGRYGDEATLFRVAAQLEQARPWSEPPARIDANTMEAFLHQVLSGLATGGIYASLALALVMIYQSTNHINFAQGEMAMFSTYLAWGMINAGIPYWWAFLLTVAISFVAGVVIERVIIRPVENAPVLSVVTVFVALLVIFNSIAGWIYTYTIKTFPSPFPEQPLFGNRFISSHELGAIGITLAVLVLLYVFFRFTPLGLAMRAAAQNQVSSRLVGIRVGWMLALGWGLAAAVGAVAGMLVAPIIYLEPNMMSGVLLYAFAAALVGGIDNPFGAVLGGFIVGVLENLIGAYVIGTELKLTVALVLIICVLLVKPTGLFGKVFVTQGLAARGQRYGRGRDARTDQLNHERFGNDSRLALPR